MLSLLSVEVVSVKRFTDLLVKSPVVWQRVVAGSQVIEAALSLTQKKVSVLSLDL